MCDVTDFRKLFRGHFYDIIHFEPEYEFLDEKGVRHFSRGFCFEIGKTKNFDKNFTEKVLFYCSAKLSVWIVESKVVIILISKALKLAMSTHS